MYKVTVYFSKNFFKVKNCLKCLCEYFSTKCAIDSSIVLPSRHRIYWTDLWAWHLTRNACPIAAFRLFNAQLPKSPAKISSGCHPISVCIAVDPGALRTFIDRSKSESDTFRFYFALQQPPRWIISGLVYIITRLDFISSVYRDTIFK